MKKARYSEEQIISILKEGEAGIAVTDLCRKYGISDQPCRVRSAHRIFLLCPYARELDNTAAPIRGIKTLIDIKDEYFQSLGECASPYFTGL